MECRVNTYIAQRGARRDADKSLYIFNDYPIFFDKDTDDLLPYGQVTNLPWLLIRELNTAVTLDHFVYWSWCALILTYHLYLTQALQYDSPLIQRFINIINLAISSVSDFRPVNTNAHINDIVQNGFVSY